MNRLYSGRDDFDMLIEIGIFMATIKSTSGIHYAVINMISAA